MWALVDDEGNVGVLAEQPDDALTGDGEWINLPPEDAEALAQPYAAARIDEKGKLHITAPPPPPRARVSEQMVQAWAEQRKRLPALMNILYDVYRELELSEATTREVLQVVANDTAVLPLLQLIDLQQGQISNLAIGLKAALDALDVTRAQLAAVGQAVCLQDAQDDDASPPLQP